MTRREKAVQEKAEAFLKEHPEKRDVVEEAKQLILSMTEEQRIRARNVLRQDRRASAIGLRLDVDTRTNAFFLADVATNAVIAPPPMSLDAITAWLNAHEHSAVHG